MAALSRGEHENKVGDRQIMAAGVVYEDTDAPEDSPTVIANADDGWHNDDATATLSAGAAVSSVQRIEHSVDTGTCVVAQNNDPVLSAAGNDRA